MTIATRGWIVLHDPNSETSYTAGLTEYGMPELAIDSKDSAFNESVLNQAAEVLLANVGNAVAGTVLELLPPPNPMHARLRPRRTCTLPELCHLYPQAEAMDLVRWLPTDPTNTTRAQAVRCIAELGLAVITDPGGLTYTLGLTAAGLPELVYRATDDTQDYAFFLVFEAGKHALAEGGPPTVGIPFNPSFGTRPLVPRLLRDTSQLTGVHDLFGEDFVALELESAP
ncbi:hypothetical protein ACFC1T_09425 [Kitasatospora sp. NPDC056076]|uniref:hypothetical protein n=1 Tax=Kitasatospora sp. NPDC056076 TaxID=3345703 RepID=UPI0035DB916A